MGCLRPASKLRKLFALLLSMLLFVGTESMSGLPPFSHGNLPTDLTEPFVRSYRLYSRCSSRYLTIRFRRRDVNARGTDRSKYAKLLLESVDHDGLIRIKSETTGRYLCFNFRGKLIVRHHGDSIQCKFREEITKENYTKFRSAAPAVWYVGFRSNGKPVKGYKGNRPEKCYQFLKKEDTKRFQPGPDGLKIQDFEAILRRRGHRLRRRNKSARVRSRG
ncbi:fibroblast growth factor 18-like isoform X2 [Liolophura sinensis]|uniref:fibroblast growth factor 18-like isoform X2 n=1 Tax=Liolophura sinensis TaxID=3198878 RepID=UPI003158AAF4